MPELAEVEFYRRRWFEAGAGKVVRAAAALPRSRVYRGLAKEFAGGAAGLARALGGLRLVESGTHGKQMWFVFRRPTKSRLRGKNPGAAIWLGVHLGMTGELRVEPSNYLVRKHDALILRLANATLAFNDPRQFGRVRAWRGNDGVEHPPWLRNLPMEVTAKEFSPEKVREVFARRARAPIKAVLLMQEFFPGIGNWMADEILWRGGVHPATPAGRLSQSTTARKIHAMICEVVGDAMRVVAGVGGKLPADLNVNIPPTWLFLHRWEDGGKCPRTGRKLIREEIGGRTTCWSPGRQKISRS